MDPNKVDYFKKMYDGECEIVSTNIMDTLTSITFFINFLCIFKGIFRWYIDCF